MADEGNIPISGRVCATRMRTIFTRNRVNPVNSSCGNRPISVCKSRDLFKNKLCAPLGATGLTNIKFGDMYCSSITTGTIITNQESPNYYSDANNGAIKISMDPDTVVTGSDGKKSFAYSINNTSSFTTCAAVASDAAAIAAASNHSYGSKNDGNYRIRFKDGLTGSLINKLVNVTYGGGTKKYNCLQKTSDDA